MTKKNVIFWDVTQCFVEDDVSEERITYIF
jgi:hypothetical protein